MVELWPHFGAEAGYLEKFTAIALGLATPAYAAARLRNDEPRGDGQGQ